MDQACRARNQKAEGDKLFPREKLAPTFSGSENPDQVSRDSRVWVVLVRVYEGEAWVGICGSEYQPANEVEAVRFGADGGMKAGRRSS